MIHIIIGTKAQLIKMAPVLSKFKTKGIEFNYISTGQHKHTINDILSNFKIKKPDYILYDGEDITSVFQMFVWGVKCLLKTLKYKKNIFKNDKNGIVIIHGDTFSTLLGAIMGKMSGLKIAHVESGLRSFNIFHPFPEEIIRLLSLSLADYMFCPGHWALSNVVKYKTIKIDSQTNTLYDSFQYSLPAIEKISLALPNKPYGVVTLHRFENIHNFKVLNRVVAIIERISQKYYLLFILHKPTELKLQKFNLLQKLKKNSNIECRNRYDYFKFIKLIINATFVISDGGSNQEECYFLGKPILLLRKATERKEGLSENCVLSKYDQKTIDQFIDHIELYKKELLNLSFSPSDIIVKRCLKFQ